MDLRSSLVNEFRRASDKIKQIELNDFLPRRIILENQDNLYKHTRRSGNGFRSNVQRRHKWTQTLSKESDITIDGYQCWQQGTLSHSLLQVSWSLTLPISNANNDAESVRKISIRFCRDVHTYSVFSLSVHCDRLRYRVEQGVPWLQ